jgi:hypothetical protein
MVEQIDAVVVGAGPAGSAAVAILASGGAATVMLTGSDATKPHWICFRNLGCQLPPCMRSCALPIARWVTVELPCRPYCIRCPAASSRCACRRASIAYWPAASPDVGRTFHRPLFPCWTASLARVTRIARRRRGRLAAREAGTASLEQVADSAGNQRRAADYATSCDRTTSAMH